MLHLQHYGVYVRKLHLRFKRAQALQVTLDVASKSQSNMFKLTRERIALKPVSSQMCGPVSESVGPAAASGKLAYVRVATFNKQTTENAKAAFRQLKADGATRYAVEQPRTGWFVFADVMGTAMCVCGVLHG